MPPSHGCSRKIDRILAGLSRAHVPARRRRHNEVDSQSSLHAAVRCCLLPLGCKREQRVFDPGSSGTQVADGAALNEVHAGGVCLRRRTSASTKSSAYAVSEGKRLYNAYNCVGCHAQGGGAIGPALMDSDWIYGSQPAADLFRHRAGPPQRHAQLRRKASRLPGVGTRRLCALHERTTAQRCRSIPLGPDACGQSRASAAEGTSFRRESAADSEGKAMSPLACRSRLPRQPDVAQPGRTRRLRTSSTRSL